MGAAKRGSGGGGAGRSGPSDPPATAAAALPGGLVTSIAGGGDVGRIAATRPLPRHVGSSQPTLRARRALGGVHVRLLLLLLLLLRRRPWG